MTANRQGWRTWGRAALVAALATAAAAHGDAPPKGAASELDLVPADGAAVISIRFAELWNHAALKAARDKMAKEAPDLPELFAKQVGASPDEVDRITVFAPPPEQAGWAVFVSTTKPYNAKKVAALLAPDGKEEKVKDRVVVEAAGGPTLAFLTDRTYVFGSGDEVLQLAGGPAAGKDGPLAPALREAAGNHLAVIGLSGEGLAQIAWVGTAGNDLQRDANAYQPLSKAKSAVLTVDLGEELKADLRVTFPGEAEAKEGEESLNAVADLSRAALVKVLDGMRRQGSVWADVVPLVKDVQAALRAVRIERHGSTVEASTSLKVEGEKIDLALLQARVAAVRTESVNKLKMLGLATHNYHDVFGRLPTNICDKSGKPLLSWRVAILPYIEQQQLYNQFHLDEPWDSEHNIKLLEKMPRVYAAPMQDEKELKQHLTRYQGFAGPGSVFGEKQGLTMAQITAADGASNTILLAEAAKGVPWSKPEAIPFDEGKLLPEVGGLFPGIFHVLLCDGSVHRFPLTMKEEELRAFITWNGGEVVPFPDER